MDSASFGFVTSGSTATGSWSFELQVTDAAGASVTSSATTVTVNSVLVAPIASALLDTVDQGQISSLTSSAVTTGTSPYTYQWFSEAPGASSYSPIDGATSSKYWFMTTPSTATGSWSFMLQVKDSTGATVNSTAVTVTVWPAVPEFQPFMLVPMFMVITLFGVVILRWKRNIKK